MKKKIARIQRWLDRLSAACETKRWDSALVESDCLSAEVREIREDLMQMMDNDAPEGVRIFSSSAFSMSIRSIGIAMFIVLVSTIPLAVEAEKPWTANTQTISAESSRADMLAWVTPEEDQLIRTLRADLSGKNTVLMEAEREFSAPLRRKSSLPAKKETVTDSEISAAKATEARPSAAISAEDLLALMQIGEKALRGDTPAIKVIK